MIVLTASDRIITEECRSFGVAASDVTSQSRARRLAPVRWAIARRLRTERQLPYARIGLLIGRFNERSVAYMVDHDFRDRKRIDVLARYQPVPCVAGTESRPRGPDGKYVKRQRHSEGGQSYVPDVPKNVPPFCTLNVPHGQEAT